MKKILKKLSLIIVIVLTIMNISAIVSTKSYADHDVAPDAGSGDGAPSPTGGMTDVTENPDLWKPSGASTSAALEERTGTILGMISIIGTIMSVVTLSMIGIKFMLGSAEEKASYKQTLMPWLIGAILVFAMTSIPSTIYNISNGIFGEESTSSDGGDPDGGGLLDGGDISQDLTQKDF